jgi:hypothetical protein
VPPRAATIGVPSGMVTSTASRLDGVVCVVIGPPGAWPIVKVRPSIHGRR